MRPSDYTVERRRGMSQDEFHRAFVRGNRPLILTDEVERWPAAKLWNARYFIEKFGDRPVPVYVHPNGMYSGHGPRQERTTFESFLHSFEAEPGARTLVCHVLKLAPFIIPDYAIPTVVSADEVESSGLWIKPAGATTGLHFDHQDGLLAVVQGEKRVLLFAPEQVDCLYPCPVRARNDLPTRNWSEVYDVFHPDFERFPRLRAAECVEVRVAAGEMLFIPKFWWHAVEHEAPLTIGVNFFLNTPHAGTWPVFYWDRVFMEHLVHAIHLL